MVKEFIAVLLLYISFALVQGQDPGFFLDDWQEKTATIPQSQWKEKTSGTATVQIQVNPAQVLRKVPSYIYGNNAVTWGGNMNLHSTIMKDINQLNPHVLRWPGGNLSQEYFWNLSDAYPPADVPVGFSPRFGVNDDNWQMSTDDYYDLLANTNSTGSICVNYSYARYGTGPDPVAKAAHLAAEWVRYDRGRSKFWEIGNENFGSWEAGYQIDVTQNQDDQPQFINGRLYGEHCRIFIDSMRAAAAEIGVEIKIGVVAYDAETSHESISTNWNEGMMPEVGDLADFLIVHSYFTPYNQDSSIPTILNSHDEASHIMTAVRNDMNEAGMEMIPVAMTEWNIFAVGSMQQVSYINGMHSALVLGEFLKNDYGMANRWDLTNGWANGDDHGMFSRAGEPGVDYYNPRPVFYYMKYFQDYFGDHMVATSVTGNEKVISYASTFSSGEVGMVFVNKGTSDETMHIDLGDHDSGARYYSMTLTGGEDNGDFSRKVFLNGVGGDEAGGGPDDYEQVKAFMSSTRDGIEVDLPGLSAVYLLVERNGPLSYVSSLMETDPRLIQVELSEEVNPLGDPAGFEVLLNGLRRVGITGIETDPDRPYLLNISLDTMIQRGDELEISYSGGTVRTLDNEPLPSFENEKVRVLLPGDPFQISFLLKSANSNTPLAGCDVNFNGIWAQTDDSGLVLFSEPEGSYPFSARKQHLRSQEDIYYSIISDTVIQVELDSLTYQVEFLLTNSLSGKPLPGVEIWSGSDKQTTDLQGSAAYFLFAGNQRFSFDAKNYMGTLQDYTIESDTTFSVELEQSHARIKFKLLAGNQPVNKAKVIIGLDSLSTDGLGICYFEALPMGQTLEYQVLKDNYYPQSGSVRIKGDTSLVLPMQKSVARVTFELTSESEPVNNAMVILAMDTAMVDVKGICKFYQVPKEAELSYRVMGETIEPFTGSLIARGDTIVHVMLAPSGAFNSGSQEDFRIYPNPASDRLFIESGSQQFEAVELLDIQGKRVSLKLMIRPQKSTTLSLNVPPGIYFVRMRTAKETHHSRIVVY